jgi:hypothetical protein
MKKPFLHPRIEIIFSLSLIAILGLPPLVLAQTQKNIEIKIQNGDTTINGKDIKKLSPEERRDALSEMDKMGNIDFKSAGKGGNRDIVIRRNQRMKGDKNQDVVIERRMDGDMDMPFAAGMGDSIRKKFTFRLRKVPGADSTFAFKFDNGGGNFRFDDERAFDLNDGPPMPMERQFRFDAPGRRRMMGFNRKNTQTFNYSNTDNDGISTNVSFRVNDASKGKTALDLNDLNLSPEFSTGKTTISFNLEAKTSADVKLTESEGKAFWSDKVAGGSFSKKINLPRNGIYFLTVKQGANVAVKRIVKED